MKKKDSIAEDATIPELSLGPGIAKLHSLQAIQQATLERSKSLERILYGSSRALSEAAGLITPTTSSSVAAVSKLIEAFRIENVRLSGMGTAAQNIDELVKRISATRNLIESITRPNQAIRDCLYAQSVMFESAARRSIEIRGVSSPVLGLSEATLAWTLASTSLAQRFQDTGLLSARPALSLRLLEASNAFSKFVNQTNHQISESLDPDLTTRLEASVKLGESQLLELTNDISSFIVLPEDKNRPDDARTLNAFEYQQTELISNSWSQNELDETSGLGTVPSAQIINSSIRVLKLILSCNKASKTSIRNTEIFSPTTRMMTVYVDMPLIASVNETVFGDFLDCLYFALYEGAGKDKLRFHISNGGPLNDDECQLIWHIKLLRNKWLRHDADHGESKAVQKSNRDLAMTLKSLGLDVFPNRASHFQQLQRKLLEMAEEFLKRLLERIPLG